MQCSTIRDDFNLVLIDAAVAYLIQLSHCVFPHSNLFALYIVQRFLFPVKIYLLLISVSIFHFIFFLFKSINLDIIT